jgi:hypothetical protein
MALVVERTHSLATWCMEIAAIRMACADHCHQIVEQDGEFRALFLSPTSSPPSISLLLSRDAILTFSAANLNSEIVVPRPQALPLVRLRQRPHLHPPF